MQYVFGIGNIQTHQTLNTILFMKSQGVQMKVIHWRAFGQPFKVQMDTTKPTGVLHA